MRTNPGDTPTGSLAGLVIKLKGKHEDWTLRHIAMQLDLFPLQELSE